jgi:hypothetical protein
LTSLAAKSSTSSPPCSISKSNVFQYIILIQ